MTPIKMSKRQLSVLSTISFNRERKRQSEKTKKQKLNFRNSFYLGKRKKMKSAKKGRMRRKKNTT